MARLAWLLVGCLVLAGCTAADPATTETVDESVENTPIDDSPVATKELSTPTPARSGVRVTVTRVVDGDTLEIKYRNGSTDTVRLLGVDTPEVHVAENPSEYEGVPDTDAGETCLGEAGDEASAFVSRTVGGEMVRVVPGGDRRDRYGRLLAFVVHDGTNLNYRLVKEGYARVYDSQFRNRERFYRAEARAQRTHTGLWACANDSKQTATTVSGSSLAVAAIAADAPGNDNANLGEETVTFENRGTNALALSGWTVRDEAGHTYSFPDGSTLAPGARLTLHTGRGTDTKTDRYWGLTSAVWNNDGDTVVVEDATGAVVARRSYG